MAGGGRGGYNDSMIIALIGADGQLGSDLRRILPPGDVRPLFYPEFDVTNAAAAASRLRELGPDVVINTSAFHRVDECENRIEDAFRVNAFAVRDLARACREIKAVLVHFSTDFVFDGRSRRPYTEEDRPGPLSAYAASKLAGESLLAAEWDRHFIIRTCGLFGRAGCLEKGRNFVETMLWLAGQGKTIRVVNDQVVAPTSSLELARTTLRRAERRAVTLGRAGLVPGEHLLPYLNRLADLLWVLARAAEQAESRSATAARPRRERQNGSR